ncbi:MAG TPA: hypothetical protein VMZ52_14490 [Bryobacteraceae bacterium]|nr:hypothetical protein [Bryobacteraceae bacterium]
MKFGLYLLVALSMFLAACAQAPQNKDAVREAIVQHLTKNSGLNMSSMDVEVTSVTFRDKQADASVAFRAKNSPEQLMSMKYTLESEGKKWIVKKKAGNSGHSEAAVPDPHGAGAPASGSLPPGHPPLPDSSGTPK